MKMDIHMGNTYEDTSDFTVASLEPLVNSSKVSFNQYQEKHKKHLVDNSFSRDEFIPHIPQEGADAFSDRSLQFGSIHPMHDSYTHGGQMNVPGPDSDKNNPARHEEKENNMNLDNLLPKFRDESRSYSVTDLRRFHPKTTLLKQRSKYSSSVDLTVSPERGGYKDARRFHIHPKESFDQHDKSYAYVAENKEFTENKADSSASSGSLDNHEQASSSAEPDDDTEERKRKEQLQELVGVEPVCEEEDDDDVLTPWMRLCESIYSHTYYRHWQAWVALRNGYMPLGIFFFYLVSISIGLLQLRLHEPIFATDYLCLYSPSFVKTYVACPEPLPPVPVSSVAVATANWVSEFVKKEMPSPILVHRHKSAIEDVSFLIAASTIKSKESLNTAIQDYLILAKKTVSSLIKLQSRSTSSVDRFHIFFTHVASLWTVAQKPEVLVKSFHDLLSQIDDEVRYLLESAITTQQDMSMSEEKLNTISKLTSQISNHLEDSYHPWEEESILGNLWSRLVDSQTSEISKKRYVRNLALLSSVSMTTRKAKVALGQVVLMLEQFMNKLDQLRRSATSGTIGLKLPIEDQLHMLTTSLNRLQQAKDLLEMRQQNQREMKLDEPDPPADMEYHMEEMNL